MQTYTTMDIPLIAGELMTGTLRDVATLTADKVQHHYDVPRLLRLAADTIDELRAQVSPPEEEIDQGGYPRGSNEAMEFMRGMRGRAD